MSHEEEPAPVDLKFIPTEDLVTELQNRFDAMVICWGTVKPNDDYYRWSGPHAWCQGLTRRLYDFISVKHAPGIEQQYDGEEEADFS